MEKVESIETKKTQKNPNHRVHPKLTPRGADIIARLNNRSLDTEGERSYTLNEEIVNSRFMSRQELIHAAKKNAENIKGIKDKLVTKNNTNNERNNNDNRSQQDHGSGKSNPKGGEKQDTDGPTSG